MKPPSGKNETSKNDSGSKSQGSPDGKTPAQRSQPSADQTPRKRRKITPFLCKQMLYDYATGMLDDSRYQAVTEVLKDTKDCRDQLNEIELGLGLCRALASAEVSFERLVEIQNVQSWRSDVKKYRSWRSWPEALRWSIGTMGATLIIAGIFSLAPWKKIHWASKKTPTAIEVAQIPPTTNSSGDTEISDPQHLAATKGAGLAAAAPGTLAQAEQGTDEDQDSLADLKGGESSGDAESDDSPDTKIALAKLQHKQPSESHAAPAPIQKAPPINTGSAAKTDVAQSDVSKNDIAQADQVTGVGSQKNQRPGKAQGFVFRAFMSLNDIDDLTPKITQNIKELGGERAGEVELGWRKGGRGSYFHFSVPESNQEKLMEKLRGYGPVRISKDPHPRVMPDGVVRFILWIEPTRK